MSNLDSNLEMLARIRRQGVQLAVDDFGTGYSSLAYLKRLPIHRLKIDRSFVAGLPTDAGDVAITRSILQMAQTFQLEVTAEGVETQAQLDYLRSIGCPAVQGFLLARPCPAAEFEERLSRQEKSGH
jgi:EAL domain-containing protein (putative c-di-GMP-specific phosphodiesterase class I)